MYAIERQHLKLHLELNQPYIKFCCYVNVETL
jgi:hypothetical protein